MPDDTIKLPEPEVIDRHLPTGIVIRGYKASTVRRLIAEAEERGAAKERLSDDLRGYMLKVLRLDRLRLDGFLRLGTETARAARLDAYIAELERSTT